MLTRWHRSAEKLRHDLQLEMASDEQERASLSSTQHLRMEGILAREIENHTCPICYELMVPPEHAPMLLFTCGHTFCSSCLHRHMDVDKKDTCPYCRMHIQSKVRCDQNLLSPSDTPACAVHERQELELSCCYLDSFVRSMLVTMAIHACHMHY